MRNGWKSAIAVGMTLAVLGGPGATGAFGQGSTSVERGKRVFAEQGCYGCHTVGKAGTAIGPDLTRIGAKYSEQSLTRWLTEPQQQKPTAHMPKIDLTDAEIRALAAYLASLN
ncbi:MAG TPA: cytochrome c [Candidatus Bathyarchaeia archaeon]|nr:cytochrome c [Candidatus Bathyarchaeia archaeon]